MPYLRRLRSAAQLNVGNRRSSEGVMGPIRSFMALALKDNHFRKGSNADLALRARDVSSNPSRADKSVATKLRCLGLCKVEMSLGGLAGSVSRRRGDYHIGAAAPYICAKGGHHERKRGEQI
jgi:hypothetical protein